MKKQLLTFFIASVCFTTVQAQTTNRTGSDNNNTQGTHAGCGQSLSGSGIACDNAPYNFSYNILGGNTGSVSTDGLGSLSDLGGPCQYIPAPGETTVTFTVTNNQENNCTGNTDATLTVNFHPIPSDPTSIIGLNTVCAGQSNVSYSTANDGNTTSYTWTVPLGSNITSGGTTGNMLMTFGPASGNVTVKANNACGSSAVFNYSITVNSIPSTPTLINGSTQICSSASTGINYSVTAVGGATSYNWTVPTGASITSANTNSITVNYGTNSGNVSVTAQNTCGISASSDLPVTVYQMPNAPGSISGTSTVCQGQTGITYSISPVANASLYTWSLSPGASISGSPTGNVITVDYSGAASNGNLSVVADNGTCHSSSSPSLFINVNPSPSTITGNTTVCAGSTTNSFSINSISGVTYNWSVPTGATITTPGPSSANSINVSFANNASSGNISVSVNSVCGLSPTVNLGVTVNPLPNAATAITGSSTVAMCPHFTDLTYTVSPIPNATSYNWTLPTGFTITGGNGNDAIIVNYNSSAVSGNITVNGVNNCGSGASSQLAVTVNTLATPQICMTTVDSGIVAANSYNIIFWDKTAYTNVDSFFIYREITTNVYQKIAAVAFDSLSEYHDHGANPNVNSFRYKISALDTCGNESAQSDYHETIHLIDLGGGNLLWNLYDIENAPNPVSFYDVLRDDNSTGNFVSIAQISGNTTSYTDLAAGLFPNSQYRVKNIWSFVCTPTQRMPNGDIKILGAINTSRSNIRSPASVGIHKNEINEGIKMLPNPFNESLSISLNSTEKAEVEIYNELGQLVIKQTIAGKGVINTANISAGIYVVKVSTETATYRNKLVKTEN